jgi:hypothetical protein
MVQTTASMLRSIATPFHDSTRSRIRRHRKPAKEPPSKQLQDELAKLVNGDAKDAGARPGELGSDEQRQIRALNATAKGKRILLLLFASSACLVTTRKALELAGVIQGPSERGMNSIPATSRRKRIRDGSDPTHKGDAVIQTSAVGLGQNNTMTLEFDPAKPTMYLGRSVPIPAALVNLADTSSEITANDLPLYWHVPRSGGATMKAIASQCLGLTIASERGVIGTSKEQRSTGNTLMVVADDKGQKYVNVDTTSPFGLERAKALKLAQFRPLDLVVSPYLQEVAQLFDSSNRGRAFALLRHPIDRGASLYYRMTQDKKLQIELARYGLDSLDKYARSDLAENNWLTRYLSGKINGELTVQDEAVAREVLRTKVMVGLLEKKEESFRRLVRFLGWGNVLKSQGEWSERCVEKLLGWGWVGKVNHPRVREGSSEWKALWDQNTFDVRLYKYAQELYELQGSMFWK